MRTAKTHVRLHGKEKFELLHGPEVSLTDQNRSFKDIRSKSVNEKIAEVHYQESDGPLRIVRFITPAEKKAREEAVSKSIAEAAKQSENLAKADAKAAEEKANKAKAEVKANLAAEKKA